MKKTLAILLALAMVFSTMTVAFAEGTIGADAQACVTLGMLKGATSAGVTADYLTTNPTRIQAAILFLRLKGLETEALAFAGTDNFADASKEAWAKPIMAYLKAHPELGWNGVGNNTFAPSDKIEAAHYYKVMLTALGYKQNSAEVIGDFTPTNIVAFAASKGLTKVAAVTNFTVNDVAVATMEALKANVKGTEKTLATALVDAKVITAAAAQTAGVYTVVPTTLAVESITVNNLREMVVKYNRAPIADEAKDKANYSINGNAPEAASLADDGVTVTLRTSVANKMGNYSTDNKLTILKAVGFAADNKITNIAAKDTVVPTMTAVSTTGPRTIKVTFSEPLTPDATVANTVNSFKLDNGTVALDTTTATFSGKSLTLKTLADLTETSHTLAVRVTPNALVDGAGFGVVPSEVAFTYAKDATPLTVTVDSSTETTVTVKFNKAINPDTFKGNGNVLISHTYNTTVNRVTGAAVTNEGDNQSFTIDFGTSKPLPPGNTNLYISYNSSTSAKIADGYGNKLAETTLVVTTVADVAKPVVEKVEFKSATSLEVTFSETIATANKANYTLKDDAGDTVTVSNAAFKAETSNKVVVLTTATMNGGAYTLTVKDVKDVSIAQNELDDVTISFTATDKVAPTVVDKMDSVNGIQVAQIGDKKVKVTFAEVMDVTTLTDKNNYKLNGSALGTDDKVEAADSNKAAIITLTATLGTTDADNNGVLDNKTITIARMKDVAGNWIEAFATDVTIAKLAPLTPYSAQMIAKDQFKLRFKGEQISGAVTGDFQVSFDNGANYNVAVTGIATSVVDGDTYITLTTGTKAANTTGANVKIQTAGNAVTAGAANEFDNAILFTNQAVTDKTAPELVSVATGDNDNDNLLDRIYVTYSEGLYVPSVSDADYTVEGYEISAVAVATNVVTLTVKEKDEIDASATPDVTQVGDIEDSSRNKLTAQDAETALNLEEQLAALVTSTVTVTKGATAGGYTTYTGVDLSTTGASEVYGFKLDGSKVKLPQDSDPNLYFNATLPSGTYNFYVHKADGTWVMFTIVHVLA